MSRPRSSMSGASTPSLGAVTTSVQVAVRIRPVTSADQMSIPARWQRSILTPSASSSVVVEPGSAPPSGVIGGPGSSSNVARPMRQAFSFDHVFAPTQGQSDVYGVAEPLIDRFMEGYNVTILAYGQTSSGKSYTMGTAAWDDIDYEGLVAGRTADPQMGIIPRAVSQIFNAMKRNQAVGVQYSVKVSFIEIYNEDLIDLLADGTGGDERPHVQIREGKNGQIIWSGLREVKVTNVAEVMNHLLQGSSVRRTNETDMNAQSSRSHAIFSINLVQKKWVGSGPPPSSASSSAYSGRSTPAGRVSNLSRASGIPMAGRVASPSFGRRTPSGIPSLGNRSSSAALRSMSMAAAHSDPADESGEGEWVTLTSKFHFVDLAGSERLKRTAAQGDRVKEGISINSGLHALGNVISALGDPSKARRTTHIPYRDSKLTRLLQDSLGGNAHTLMIACVSPTEYNVSETVNTLQYANRARNIKNKAELNEVEIGWDDIDYLQTLVQKLRKELSIIKGVGKGMVDLNDPKDKNSTRSAHKETLLWQDKYAMLSQKHTQLTAEVTKLHSQLDPNRRDDDSEEAFFKAAEPIIVEYEKSIDALEGQLNLLKAESAYLEDLANEREAQIEQQSAQLEIISDELEAKEFTVAELQARLTKMQERETSADVYARELEARLEDVGSRGNADSAVLVELHKEIAKLKESSVTSEQYIKDLEAKLAASDVTSTTLIQKVTVLEAELETRDESYRSLLSRFEVLDNDQKANSLGAELETKDLQLQQYEKQLSAAASKHEAISSQHDTLLHQHSQLTASVGQYQVERDDLSKQVAALQLAASAAAVAGVGAGTLATVNGHNQTAERSGDSDSDVNTIKELDARLQSLQEEMRAVRDSESSIRAELEVTGKKYRDSLQEIKALNTQLTDIKLSGKGTVHAASQPQAESGEEELEMLDSQADENHLPLSPDRSSALSRRSNNRRPESLLIDTTNRQPTSHLTRRSSGSFLGYNTSDGSRGVVAVAVSSPLQHVRTRSVSQSFSSESAGLSPQLSKIANGPRPLSLTGSVPPSPTLRKFEHDSPANYERKLASLERETMRLQQALKERDDEIQSLEFSARNAALTSTNSALLSAKASDGLLAPGHVTRTGTLTPATESELDSIKRFMAHAQEGTPSSDGTAMLDNLMRSMARKETQHRETIESMTEELALLRARSSTLEPLPNDEMAKMALEIEQLRKQVASETNGPALSSSSRSLADELHDASVSKPQQMGIEQMSHEPVVAPTTMIHELETAAALQAEEYQDVLSKTQQEHAAQLASLQEEHETSLREALATQEAQVKAWVIKHKAELDSFKTESRSLSTSTQEAHAKAMELQKTEHAAQLALLHESHQAAMEQVKTKLEAQHSSALSDNVREVESRLLVEHSQRLDQALLNLQIVGSDRDETRKAYEELHAVHQETLEKANVDLNVVETLRAEVADTSDALMTLEAALTEAQEERDQLLIDMDIMRQSYEAETAAAAVTNSNKGLSGSTSHSEADVMLRRELETHKSMLSKTKGDMSKLKAELQAAREEGTRHAQAVKELQLRMATSETRSIRSNGSGSFGQQSQSEQEALAHAGAVSPPLANGGGRASLSRPVADYESFLPDLRSHRPNVGVYKPPPPTPPPNMPPPPTPTGDRSNGSILLRTSSGVRTSMSSQMTRPESPMGGMTRSSSVASTHSPSHAGMLPPSDLRLARVLTEQAEEIKSLVKQLNQGEADLQANIDLVATLEAALNDSERNLRKSRVQLAEVTRERERYLLETNEMRAQLNSAQSEVENVRNSVLLEKRSYESKMEEERLAKEKARKAVESRLEEASKRKNNKLFCM